MIVSPRLNALSPVISIVLMVAVTVGIVSLGAVFLIDFSGESETSFSTAAVDVTENKDGSKTVRVLRMAESESVMVSGTRLDEIGETYTVRQAESVVKTESRDGSQIVLRDVQTSVSTGSLSTAPDGCVPLKRTRGTGTPDNPHVITNVAQLQSMNCNPTASYVLGTDIDASYTDDWNNGNGFNPIPLGTTPFDGSFDGQGHTISGLNITHGDATGAGLFAVTGSQATIGNVTLTNVDVEEREKVGALIGNNEGGGVVNAFASGEVTGSGDTVGGLIGRNAFGGSIENSSANVNVTGQNNNVGGLVGVNTVASVSTSFAAGHVSGTTHVGGLVGSNLGGSVSNSYATGRVDGSDTVGGLLGLNRITGASVSNSFATGQVTGSNNVGGLVADNRGSVAGSYWDTVATGQSTSDGNSKSLTTSEMQGQSSASNMGSLDFSRVWETVTSEYPVIRAIDKNRQLRNR